MEHSVENGGDCHCEPVLTYDANGDMVWTHNSYDRRELLEAVSQIAETKDFIWKLTLN